MKLKLLIKKSWLLWKKQRANVNKLITRLQLQRCPKTQPGNSKVKQMKLCRKSKTSLLPMIPMVAMVPIATVMVTMMVAIMKSMQRKQTIT
jgi:hypothetical protein